MLGLRNEGRKPAIIKTSVVGGDVRSEGARQHACSGFSFEARIADIAPDRVGPERLAYPAGHARLYNLFVLGRSDQFKMAFRFAFQQ